MRVMSHDEYARTSLHEFGLEQPRCAVVLSDGRRALLEASFGAYNPQDLLQYMQSNGRTRIESSAQGGVAVRLCRNDGANP